MRCSTRFLLSSETGVLLSYVNNFIEPGQLPMSEACTLENAKATLDYINERYAKGLTYMRTDPLTRSFINGKELWLEKS